MLNDTYEPNRYEQKLIRNAEAKFWAEIIASWGAMLLFTCAAFSSGDIGFIILAPLVGSGFALYRTYVAYTKLGANISGSASAFDEKCMYCGKRLKYQDGNALLQGQREHRCRSCGADQPILNTDNAFALGLEYRRNKAAARQAKRLGSSQVSAPVRPEPKAPDTANDLEQLADTAKPECAGWHPDPLNPGHIRFYNGTNWTWMIQESSQIPINGGHR